MLNVREIEFMRLNASTYISVDLWIDIIYEGETLTLKRGFEEPKVRTLSDGDLDKLQALIDEAGVESWEALYRPKGRCCSDDREDWALTIRLKDQSEFFREGSNAWPRYYDILQKGLLELVGE